MSNVKASEDLTNYDPVQAALMEEMCILVDRDDNVTGVDISYAIYFCYVRVLFEGHLMTNIDQGMLHRAFSVFLFNTKGELLLQQRSDAKITFPGYWTNTCCSHPLYFPEEMVDEGQLGVRRAAQRKLDNELGIAQENIDLNAFQYITRIHYLAPSDGVWGEHEVDYILFLQAEIPFRANPEEIKDTRFVTQAQLKDLIAESKKEGSDIKLTPWFALMADSFIWKWWDALLDGTLAQLKDNIVHHA